MYAGCRAMQGFTPAWTIGQVEVSERKLLPLPAAGISTLYYSCGPHEALRDLYMPAQWHEHVALTADSGIRLRLSGRPCAPYNVLLPPSPHTGGYYGQPPARSELIQRLTALDISVAFPGDVAVVCSLAALRHLRMACSGDADMRLLPPLDAAHRAWQWQWQLSSLRTLQLIRVPPAAFFLPDTAACLQQLHSLRLNSGYLPHSKLPAEMLHLQSLSRLELMQLSLHTMPDLRGLPALRTLSVRRKSGRPRLLDASQAECSAELKAALLSNPLGGATGLTAVALHELPIPTQACAEAIERLPKLRLLGLDYFTSEEGA